MTHPQSPGPDPKALRELLAKATGRPWFNTGDIARPEVDIAADPYPLIGQPPSGNWPNNAALIVAAVNALPGLLDRLEAAERTIEVMSRPRYHELRALAAEPNTSNTMTASDFRKRLGLGPPVSP